MVNLAALKVGRLRYNSPWTQVGLTGFVVFCSVGMFPALGGLGAGGIQDVQLYAISNSVLYACFCIAGFVAGSINNILGPRLTMSIGTVGYSIYVGSLWAHQVHGIRIFLIVAGGFLGITAALLWAAQGSIMMAYPLEKDKGRSFALFWCLFQSGTLVGAAIALGIQFNSTLPTVGTGVYVAFVCIMLTAIVTSWLILPPKYVVRGDGTLVEIEAAISPKQEFREFLKLFKDWRMLALFPMFFSSNYFYAYQGAITAVLFNGRTRALVSLLTGLGSLSGAIVLGLLTDKLPFGRRNRALCACLFVLVINCVIWGAGLGFQVQFDRASIIAEEELLGAVTPWDFTQSGSAGGPISLLMFYYLGDAAYQGLAYYTMSSLTNDPYRLARMAGYYKGVQSAGAAVSFGMDAVRTPYLAEHLVSWLLLLVSLPLCFLVLYHVRDTNYDVEGVTHAEDVDSDKVHGAAMPKGHHTHNQPDQGGLAGEDKKDADVTNVALSR